MNAEPKWRRFEKLVASIQNELAPDAQVTHNDHILGQDSKTLRQVDVSVKKKVGQYDMLIAIDCKDYAVPADVKDVEEFAGLVKDIRANKGAMVVANGFTETAKRIGENAGLDLYRLIDAEAHDWQSYVSIPFVCDFRRMRFRFRVPSVLPQTDPQEIMLYTADRKPLGTITNLLMSQWNSGQLPLELGEHTKIPVAKVPIMALHAGQFIDVNILADIFVTRRLFFGHLPLINFRGFRDEYTGQIFTPGFTTDWLIYEEVEKSWLQLESADDLAVKPVAGLVALDHADFII